MTDLIQSQLKTMVIMAYCGMTAGLIIEVFRLFISRFLDKRKITATEVKIVCCVAIAFLIGDFSFFCENGRITLAGAAAFAAGLWLWRKFFYGIITTRNR